MTTSVPVNEKIAQHLQYLEQSLLSPSVRRDRDRVVALLANDFVEFGSSGKIWTREQVLEMLGTEEADVTPAVEDLNCNFISEGVVLLTYKTRRTNEETGKSFVTLRSSLWAMQAGVWQLRFHQGTPAR
jgi:hypothetical protein